MFTNTNSFIYAAVTNSNVFLLGNFIITMLNILCVAFMKKSILMDIHIIEYERSLVKSLAIMYMVNYKKILNKNKVICYTFIRLWKKI